MKCCAIDRAISCSTIWVSAKTTWRWACAPTAPTLSTSCAPISRSRWGCRSATRIARAAAAARRRSATSGSTSSIPSSHPSGAAARTATASTGPGDRARGHARPDPQPVADLFPAGRAGDELAGDASAANPLAPNPPKPLGLVGTFGEYLRAVGDVVHPDPCASSANDDNTDFYTVPLTQETLRPGTVYADPYGHVLMLVQRVPESDGAAGVFLAVDAEPDGTVTRKRFWRGNFLFVHDPALGQPRLQALPADRAREERRVAAADQRGNREKSAVRRFFARAVAARGRGFLRSHGRRDVARAARSAARDGGGDHGARRAGEDARYAGRKRAKIPDQRARRRRHAERPVDLRDHRRLGEFRDAGARFSSVDRDRRGARVSRSRRAAARALRDSRTARAWRT